MNMETITVRNSSVVVLFFLMYTKTMRSFGDDGGGEGGGGAAGEGVDGEGGKEGEEGKGTEGTEGKEGTEGTEGGGGTEGEGADGGRDGGVATVTASVERRRSEEAFAFFISKRLMLIDVLSVYVTIT